MSMLPQCGNSMEPTLKQTAQYDTVFPWDVSYVFDPDELQRGRS